MRATLPNQSSPRHMRCGFPAWLSAPLAVATLLLAGCASLEPVDHPQEWRASPGGALANGCPDLAGSYSVHPTAVYPSNLEWHPSLDEALGLIILSDLPKDRPKPWPALAGATRAVFVSDGDWLHVSLRDDADGEASVRFKRKSWWGGFHEGADAMPLCMQLELGPAMLFEGGRRPLWAAPFGAGQAAWFGEVEFDSVILSRARDGSLIVNLRKGRIFITTILIGTYARWVDNVWWRYPPVGTDR